MTLNSFKEIAAQTFWIDVNPINGNLIATCGTDKNIKIYDRRESKIVKTFQESHTGKGAAIWLNITANYSTVNILDFVNCVRWDSIGEMLASAADDKTVKLWDFKTEDPTFTRMTPDGGN